MRIVITSNYPVNNETGASKVAELLVKYLSKNNQVAFICLGKNYSEEKKSKNITVVKIPMLDLTKFQIPLITPIVVFKTFAFLEKFRPDIIHAQNSVFVSKVTQIWSILNKVPFVVTFHHIPTEALYHLAPFLTENKLGNIVQDLYKNTSLKNTLKNSDAVIAVNKLIFESVRTVDKGINIKIINNGIETNKLSKIKINNLDKEKIRFVFLGSFNDRKNQLYLLRVFKNLPKNYYLNLYGKKDSGGEYLKKLESYVNKNRMTNVKINDYSTDIVSVFESNNFLISASKKEAQSLVVLQSMAAAKPVIALENETINELININNGLKIKQNTKPINFAKKIVDYIENSDYVNLSNNIRKDSKKFDIEVVVSKINEFYKSVCDSYSKNGRRDIGNYYNKILQQIGVIK